MEAAGGRVDFARCWRVIGAQASAFTRCLWVVQECLASVGSGGETLLWQVWCWGMWRAHELPLAATCHCS